MSLHVAIIGIDGSGKSTVTPALASLAAAELGVTAAAVGDELWCKTPTEDLCGPGFAPDGEMLPLRLGRLFRRAAKLAAAHRRLYPPLKLAHLALQEWTATQIAGRYHPALIFCEGNLLLSAAGRAINYVHKQVNPSTSVTQANFLPRLGALYGYVMEGRPLSPDMVRAIPGLNMMRWLRRIDARLQLGLMRLPDAIIYLDIEPETALARLSASGQKLDQHENVQDLTQARTMYRRAVSFFRSLRGERYAAVIDVTSLSVEQALHRVLDFVRTLPVAPTAPAGCATRRTDDHTIIFDRDSAAPAGCVTRRIDGRIITFDRDPENLGQLGTAGAELSQTSAVVKKALTYRYLVRGILPNLGRGSARELAFPLSRLGKLLFKEGYSAEMMKAIYLQDSQPYGLFDRIFLGYPLHRAIYHRLQILNRLIETELRQRLDRLVEGDVITIMTAPSGYAFDLFQPLERIAPPTTRGFRPIYILASDLDPTDRIKSELIQAARRAGIGFEFVRGDLTSAYIRKQLQCTAPYDIVVFVGLSTWMPRPHLVSHLRRIREHLLAPGGVLFAECFTPRAFALTGKYLGYKANYYQPREFTTILAYCGFAPGDVTWASGPEGINHVCVARMPEREARQRG